MFYKEWKSVQMKFWLWLIVYGFFAAMYALFDQRFGLLGTYNQMAPNSMGKVMMFGDIRYVTPLYQNWLNLFFYLTAINAVLGGVDAIAEEKSRQTLGFLLSRPVPRNRIYTAKIFTNAVGLWAAGILASAVVWLVDITGPKPFDIRFVIFTTLAFLLLGTMIICLTALISIYTHSAIQTLMISIIALAGLYLTPLNNNRWNNPAEQLTLRGLTVSLAVSACVALALYYAGLICFKRKEF